MAKVEASTGRGRQSCWHTSDQTGDLICFTIKNDYKQRPIQRRMIFLVLYYISAGQTSLLQAVTNMAT